MLMTPESVASERQARIDVWRQLQEDPNYPELPPARLRELGAYGGQQGVWVDKDRTRTLAPEGVAVGILHRGIRYADDLDESGIVYHFPRTSRPRKRDQGESQALRNAQTLGLPLFVISEAKRGAARRVRLGWVVDHDDAAEVVLILFGDAPPAASARPVTESEPFVKDGPRRTRTTEVTAVLRDPEFTYRVLRRYSGRCALSGLAVQELLDAAHVIPVAEGGPDDERNGLLLSANLHRALDRFLWALEPETLKVVTRRSGPDPSALGMVRTSLAGEAHPHPDALAWRYERFMRETGQKHT